jgi:hypothetical protein
MGKEAVNLYLLTDGMLKYVENPTEFSIDY